MQVNHFEAAGLKCAEVLPDEASAELPLVIGLHGRGDWGESYLDIGPMISETAYRYIFPTAPLRLEGALFEWFRFESPQVSKEAAKARLIIFKLLEELATRYNISASRIFLFGFSQGGMMTLDAGLRYRSADGQRLAGLSALSGLLMSDTPFRQNSMANPAQYYEQDESDLKEAVAGAAADKLPVFIAHGSYDPVVPVRAGQAARDFLRQNGLAVEYYEFPGEHQIILPEIENLSAFIAQSLAHKS